MFNALGEELKQCGVCRKVDLKTSFSQNKKGEFYNTCKECLEKKGKYRETHRQEIREQAKEYYRNNIEKKQENNRKYYYENREELLEKQTEKRECKKCGAMICKVVMKRHQRTAKCAGAATARTATASSSSEQAP